MKSQGVVMSFRSKAIALSGAIVLLSALYLFGALGIGQGAIGGGRPLFANLEPSRIEAIEIWKEGMELVALKRTDDAWSVAVGNESFPASSARVAALVASLRDLRRTKMMSSNPSLLSSFDLTAQKAGRIVALSRDGSKLAEIEVGKQAASGYEDYVRVAREKEVYLCPSSLSFYLGQGLDYWYDLSILPDDVTGATISSIAVSGDVPLDLPDSYARDSYRVERPAEDGRWALVGRASSVDQTRASVMANSLATLQGIDFVLDLGALAPGGHRVSVTVATSSGVSYVIDARAIQGGERFVVTRSGVPFLYLVNREALRRAVLPQSLLVSR